MESGVTRDPDLEESSSKPSNAETKTAGSETLDTKPDDSPLSSEPSSPTTATASDSTPTVDSDTTTDGVDCTDSVKHTQLDDINDEYKAPELTSHCGVGPWHPSRLQVFAKPKVFTLLICIHALVEGAIVSGFTSVVISSIEKRYRFSSTAASMIVAVFDIAVTVSVIFISYFGHNGHKPRWLGIGLIIQGIGAFVFALPQFIFGKYNAGNDAKLILETCDDPIEVAASCDPANNIAYSLFIIGNILIGIGAAPLFTIGVSFIDDIVYPKYVSIHLGLFQASVVIGPAIGYGLGGAFLSIFVDPSESTNLDENDPGWVGAWWLCFVVSGIASILISIPFLMYPRELHNTHKVTAARRKEMADEYTSKYGDSEEKKNITLQLKTFHVHMKKILLNPSYMLVTFGISFLFLSLEGMVSFGPKYVEEVFSIPASVASVIIGAVAIPAGGIGTIVGALIVFFTKATGKKLPIISWVICLITLVPPLGFFITCPNLNVAGIYADYANNSLSTTNDILLSSCNFDCNCTSTIFEPVCGADGITYFSPCRAGCQMRTLDGVPPPDNLALENCTCITSVAEDLIDVLPMTATNGKCDQNCNLLGPWAFILAVFVFLLFVIRVPTTLTTLRAVADEQRTLALGVQSVLLRVFGSIPGPIIFGVIFDSGCVYWQFECGRRANCWVYNNNVLGVRAFAIAVAGIIGSVVLFILCWLFYPPVTTCNSGLCKRQDDTSDDVVSGINKGFELDPASPTTPTKEVNMLTNI